MKFLREYLSTNIKVKKHDIIYATDETLYRIVRDEIKRLGTNADLNHIDVSNVKNFFYGLDRKEDMPENILGLFEDLDFQGDVSKWDMSNAKITTAMFYKCENFNCDISNWNISDINNCRCMFRSCKNFNQDLSKWKMKKNVDAYYMFKDCGIEQQSHKWPNFLDK